MEQQIIKCVFCKGTGENPYFKGTCPVCKGKGKNQITGKYMACGDCRSSGQKRGTTLTCYTCAGLGVIPDTREELKQARQEIGKVREEMEQEKQELYQKPREKNKEGEIFCQCCGSDVKDSITIKICRDCFSKLKELRA